MATLSVLIFAAADGAQQMEITLLDLQQQQLIQVQDAALVTWPQGKNPKTEHLHSLAGQGALSGAFWGMLFGLIFFDPCLGPAGGATAGALGEEFNDFGIDDNFVRLTRSKVTEGASALFLLTSGAVKEGIIAALQSQTFELIAANLPHEKEGALHAAFGAE